MVGKRTAATADPDAGSVTPLKSTRALSKRQRVANSEEPGTSETAGQAIVVKEEETDPGVPMLTSENVVVIDDQYDMTLVVGTVNGAKGIKAFRISRGCLRAGGDALKNKIGGSHARSEIHFPDDSPDAFLIVLHILHWQQAMLPKSLNREDLLELATLCDKYSLHQLVMTIVHFKKWLDAHGIGGRLPVNADIQDWIMISYFFRMKTNYEYLTNSLAMNLQATRDETSPSLYFNNNGNKIMIREGLPGDIESQLRSKRSDMLQQIEDACRSAFETALDRKVCDKNKSHMCVSTSVGFFVRVYHAMEMPLHRSRSPGARTVMPHSVRFYWHKITSMSARYIGEFHASGSDSSAGGNPRSQFALCSYNSCMRDFDPYAVIKAVLDKYDHGGLRGDWASIQTLGPSDP